MLEQAIEQKIEEQVEFVGWWAEHVGAHQGRPKKNADRGSFFSCEKAEELTGISQQQVAKWKKRLGDRAKYRAALFGVAWRKAMAEMDNHRAQGTGENEWYTPQQYIERRALPQLRSNPSNVSLAQETAMTIRVHCEQPRLCDECMATARFHAAVAAKRCFLMPCQHNIVLASVTVEGGTITRWELEGPMSLRELREKLDRALRRMGIPTPDDLAAAH